jgi:O-antigen/teichoic acid export membrane protein
MAFLIGALLSIIPSTAAQVLFAEASRDRAKLGANTRTAIKAIYGLLLPAAGLLYVLAPTIMALLGRQYELHATNLVRALAAGSLFLGGTYIIDSILTAVDRMRAYFAINAINSLLVVGLVALVAAGGMTDIGLAWVAAQAVSLVIGAGILFAPRIGKLSALRASAGASRAPRAMRPLRTRGARPDCGPAVVHGCGRAESAARRASADA